MGQKTFSKKPKNETQKKKINLKKQKYFWPTKLIENKRKTTTLKFNNVSLNA